VLRILDTVTEFAYVCLSGRVPEVIQPVFCGASLCALSMKDGGIRPIAVGGTLRRLVVESACKMFTSKMSEKFAPIQIVFGVQRATEAAAHAARRYIHGLQHGECVPNMDFSNALNSVHRDSIIQAARDELSEL
jgi:hypothetical protein